MIVFDIAGSVGAADEGSGIYRIDFADGSSREATVAEILRATKNLRLILLRNEASRLITTKWPLWAQNNCALGVYPDATVAQCTADIAAVIAASNTAEDAIEAATTVAEVEAVTATWPTL
jgi:hypothetical protein